MTPGLDHDLLSRTPTELLETIFGLLPQFTRVFALAATCHRLRHIWTTTTNIIYRRVAPRCIPCEPYARNLLADQGGPARESPLLSSADVRRLVHNSWVVEKSISEFEWKILSKVRTGPWDAEKAYGTGWRQHPPCLTRTELPRFIRSYYQLWSLMELDPGEWQSRLEAVSLKQLILSYEMSNLTQTIGSETGYHYGPYDIDNQSQHPAGFRRSDKRSKLSRRIRKHMENTYRHIHHEGFDDPWVLAKEEGYLFFVVLWDHWQPPFKDLVCCRQFGHSSSARSFDKLGVWDDSSDEDRLP